MDEGQATPLPQGTPARRRWKLAGALCVLALAFAAFLPALRSGEGFVLDDVALVGENPRLSLRGDGLKGLISGRYWDRRRPEERLWRPSALLSLALDAALFGRQAPAFRRTNVILHALTSLGVFLLALRVLSLRPALIAGLLFASHPIHAEAVVSAANGRCELLALAFSLAACLLHLGARDLVARARWLRAGGALLAATLCWGLAWTSKESALIGPLLLLLLEFVRARRQGVRAWAELLLPYLLTACALSLYCWARWVALDGQVLPRPGAWALGRTALSERVLLAASTALEGALTCLIPAPTAAHYPLPSLTSGTIPAGAAWLGVLTVTLPAGLALAQPERGLRALGVGVLGLFVAQVPALNLIPIGVVRADRLLYGPSLFACLLLGALSARLLRAHPRRRLFATIALGLALGVFLPRLGDNARAWTRAEWIWAQTLARYPDLGRAHLELGRSYADLAAEDPEARGRAKDHLRRALQVYAPRRPSEAGPAAQARCALARLVARESFAEAWVLFEEARHIDPTSPEAWLGLAELYERHAPTRDDPGTRLRDLRLAERYARTCANQVAPFSEASWLRLGSILAKMPEREQEALKALDQGVARGARPWGSLLARAQLLTRLGRPTEAWPDYVRLLPILEVGAELSPPERRALRPAREEARALAERLGLHEESAALAALLAGGG